MFQKEKYEYNLNMQLTLEEHFENLASFREDAKILHSLWELLRKDFAERLINSRSVFSSFSLHDSTHSKTIISLIEMFLGEERIRNLSATDTFMLLCCAYAHDYGMAISVDKIYAILQGSDFENFVCQEYQQEESEYFKHFKVLKSVFDANLKNSDLANVYLACIITLEQYLRPMHWKGVEDIERDFYGLFGGRLKIRLVKSIIQICQMHGAPIKEISKLERYAQGAGTDIYHPRFIAAMLQLGDLLDLDNNRFPRWFVESVMSGSSTVPSLSQLHYKKHESISHLYVGPKRIRIIAQCEGEDAIKVAQLLDDWLNTLEYTCDYLTKEWTKIVPVDFGHPPYLSKREIYVRIDSTAQWRLYSANNRPLQMQMSQKRVLRLLEGTNIYRDRYVGIRELVQNAIDASLLQLWYDIQHNKYINLLDKEIIHGSVPVNLLDIPPEVFRFYDIHVELIRDRIENKLFIVIKDQGIGITKSDVEFMANIGESKERNQRVRKILNTMPNWLKPSGIFGIGLQSVFQLTDQIKFFSRRPNEAEQEIVFSSYGRNRGRIEVQNLADSADHIFYDNYMQGTNVKFAVDYEKLFQNPADFQFYEPEFDGGEHIDAAFAELSHVIDTRLRETPFDYFNVYFQTMTVNPPDPNKPVKQPDYRRVYCFFQPLKDKEHEKILKKQNIYRQSVLKLRENCQPWEGDFFATDHDLIYYWDSEKSLYYLFTIHPCEIKDREHFGVPKRSGNEKRLRVWYKFTELTDLQHMFSDYEVSEDSLLTSAFYSIEMIIFDSPADDYLNIDRQQLKKGKFTVADLEKILKKVFERLAQRMVEFFLHEKNSTKPQKRGTELRNLRFMAERKEYLLALTLPFYRYAEPAFFDQFVKLCPEIFGWKLYLGNCDISLGEFCRIGMVDDNFRAVFSLSIPDNRSEILDSVVDLKDPQNLFAGLHALLKEGCDVQGYPKLHGLLTAIPSRYLLVQGIESIRNDDQIQLCYTIRLKKLVDSQEYGYGIYMGNFARLTDYYMAVDIDKSYHSLDFKSLIKKLFKPDLRFPHLIVYRKPKNFRMGDNFLNDLEKNINEFILSPFNDENTVLVRKFVTNEGLVEGEWSSEVENIWNDIKGSAHFQRCIDYIVKYDYFPLDFKAENQLRSSSERRHYRELMDGKIRSIESEYREFVKEFCYTLKKNFLWVFFARGLERGESQHKKRLANLPKAPEVRVPLIDENGTA